MNALLVLNAGSSSLKFGVFPADDGAALLSGQIDAIGIAPRLNALKGDEHFDEAVPEVAGHACAHEEALAWLLDWLDDHLSALHLVAAGHRVVHGGSRFSAPVRIDDTVLAELEALVPLAPLHQPHNLRGMRALAAQLPELPQVACFDTAFHHTQDARAAAFALPRALTDEGLRRYGFHGLSYDYVSTQLPAVLGERAAGRVIVAHLGAGASLCGMLERRSVATTMGFTALDGLMMATRPGSLDPGVLLYLMDHQGMDVAQLNKLLYHQSGLLGVSGVSADMRMLLASDVPAAAKAVELFCYRAAREIGSMMAALGGLDAIAFTAGIGEHSAPVRARICELMGWAGVRLDAAPNQAHATRIEATDSTIAVAVVATDEEAMIARYTRNLLQAS